MVNNEFARRFIVSPTSGSRRSRDRIASIRNNGVVLISHWDGCRLDFRESPFDEGPNGCGKRCGGGVRPVLSFVELYGVANDAERSFCPGIAGITGGVEHPWCCYSGQDSYDQYNHYKLYQAKGRPLVGSDES
jgi:hypothetical protein